MIDWTKVNDLHQDVGADAFAEVVELFLRETDETIASLGAAPAEATLHSLKGSGMTLGFTDLAALCADGERRAAAGEDVDLGAIRTAYADARAAFIRELDARLLS